MQHSLKLDEPNSPQSLPLADYDRPVGGFCGIALIGEAPGAEEARLGRPFVGRSGQLLDKILLEAGINRRQCLVANVFRFQPPGNKVDHFFMSRRAAANEGVELAEKYGLFSGKMCRSDYATEIESLATVLAEIKPSIIVALGRTPLWALTGENALLEKVGKTYSCRLYEGAPVMPTYHPSFILRGNWKLQPNWLDHFAAAKSYTVK